MGTSNAVNLTDGLDGLAIGCSVSVFVTYAIFCYVAGNVRIATYLLLPSVSGAGELGVFCAALAGSGLGLSLVQLPPGAGLHGRHRLAFALGGVLGVIAICVHQEIVLIIAGGVFVLEAGSVLIAGRVVQADRQACLRSCRRCITISNSRAGTKRP